MVFIAMQSRVIQTCALSLCYTTVNIYFQLTIHSSLFRFGLINFTILEFSYTILNGMESSTLTNVVTECVSSWKLFVFVSCEIDSGNADRVLAATFVQALVYF